MTTGTTSCSAPPGLHGRPRPLDGVDVRPTAAPRPPGPNFSWVLAARALRRAATGSTCPACAIALNGAEPVDPGDGRRLRRGRRAATACGPARCSPPSAWPRSPSPAPSPSRCPGCAPTPSTAGCSRPSATRRPVDPTPTAPGASPSSAGRCRASRSASSTRSPATCSQEREVGELEIRGTSVTPGYYKRPDANAELFHDGWLRTGDLAYLRRRRAGHVRPHQGHDHRRRPQRLPRGRRAGGGRRRGRPGRQRHRLRRRRRRRARRGSSSWPRASPDDHAEVRRSVAAAGARRHRPARPRRSCSSQPGSLPKTSSGKLQRSLCKVRYLGQELQAV